MRMCVHEPGRKRRVAEIDHLRALRDGQVAAGISNLVALDDNNAVRHQRLRFAVEESSGFESDDGRNWVCGECNYHREHRGRREKTKQILHSFEYEIRRPKARLPGRLTRGTVSGRPACCDEQSLLASPSFS